MELHICTETYQYWQNFPQYLKQYTKLDAAEKESPIDKK